MSAGYEREMNVATNAVSIAGRICRAVQRSLGSIHVLDKADSSPVTIADFASQAIICSLLKKEFPADLVIAEEDSSYFRSTDSTLTANAVTDLVSEGLSTKFTLEEVLDMIDIGKRCDESPSRFWTVDPIDGTKGFLRGDQYSVCLALIVNHQVQLAVLACPNLPFPSISQTSMEGCIFGAVRGQGAFQRTFDDPTEYALRVKKPFSLSELMICESAEPSHSSHSISQRLRKSLDVKVEPLKMDSQCKYGCLARGDAGLYFRIPTDPNYQEKTWDHAAGSLIVEEAGGIVTDITGNKLDFSHGSLLAANKGVIGCHPENHLQILTAIQQIIPS